ncbi:spermatogenesis-associated protein 4 [Borealophlyctis nickersoniae]|nr:spermatogenesis-associated protein 4 [Borealophlyctis nickersoniae]
MSGLPREVIKWLQSLDLSYPVKNPKRDFANGFLLAEIFSRYFPGEQLLRMHQFYTGESGGHKRSNWELLRKFFKKYDIRIPPEACDAVMTCQIDAALLFVENVYMLLTDRRVHRQAPTDSLPLAAANPSSLPHFALPTTSNIIRCVAESPAKAQVIVDAHRDYIKQLRAHRAQTQTQSHHHAPAGRFDDRELEAKAEAEDLHAHAHKHASGHETVEEAGPVLIQVRQIMS